MAEYNPSKIIKDGNTYNFRDTTKIPLAGSNQISGDLIPSTDGTVNLGGSSYQWNNAYIKSLTINGVACGDILTHNVSEFVNVTGEQTIGGVKTFSNGDKTFNDSAPLRIQGCNKGNEFSPNARTVLELRSNRDTADKSCIYMTKFRQNRAQGSMSDSDSVILTMDVLENEVRTNDLFRFTFKGWVNDVPTKAYLEPYSSDTQTFLGTTSHAWEDVGTKAINGINPGALSLPGTNYISLDTTSFDVTATTIGTFTPTVDGWAILSISQKNKPFGIWILQGSYRVTFQSVYHQGDYMIFALIPVWTNLNLTIYCTADDIDSTRKIEWLRLFPCKGNV